MKETRDRDETRDTKNKKKVSRKVKHNLQLWTITQMRKNHYVTKQRLLCDKWNRSSATCWTTCVEWHYYQTRPVTTDVNSHQLTVSYNKTTYQCSWSIEQNRSGLINWLRWFNTESKQRESVSKVSGRMIDRLRWYLCNWRIFGFGFLSVRVESKLWDSERLRMSLNIITSVSCVLTWASL